MIRILVSLIFQRFSSLLTSPLRKDSLTAANSSYNTFALAPLIRYLAVMTQKPQLVLNTCPDIDTARRIADTLVEQGLAACVNIVPGIQSIYRWQGKVECDEELLLIIKSQSECYPALEAVIQAEHPYELPEIVTVPIDSGLPAYLDWINTSTSRCDD